MFFKVRMRMVLLNIINILIKKYELDETRFLKCPIPIFMTYISSNEFKEMKM
jgi:hypothetical protein